MLTPQQEGSTDIPQRVCLALLLYFKGWEIKSLVSSNSVAALHGHMTWFWEMRHWWFDNSGKAFNFFMEVTVRADAAPFPIPLTASSHVECGRDGWSHSSHFYKHDIIHSLDW